MITFQKCLKLKYFQKVILEYIMTVPLFNLVKAQEQIKIVSLIQNILAQPCCQLISPYVIFPTQSKLSSSSSYTSLCIFFLSQLFSTSCDFRLLLTSFFLKCSLNLPVKNSTKTDKENFIEDLAKYEATV